MLYSIFRAYLEDGYSTFGSVVLLSFLLLIGLWLAWAIPNFIRIIFLPLLALESYFMSGQYACGAIGPFNRAKGTYMACSFGKYDNYLAVNFGVDHWYVLCAYALLILFCIWPLIYGLVYRKSRIIKAPQAYIDHENKLNEERIRLAARYKAARSRIESQ